MGWIGSGGIFFCCYLPDTPSLLVLFRIPLAIFCFDFFLLVRFYVWQIRKMEAPWEWYGEVECI